MERIDHTSNLPAATNTKPAVEATVNPGYFRRPSAALGIQGTVLTADWANDIQEELATVITTNGLSLTKGTTNQLFNAIEAQIDGNVATEAAARAAGDSTNASDLTSHANVLSSETVRGHIEIATSGEVANLTNTARALTPANLEHAFAVSKTTNGHLEIPGGIQINWGTDSAGEVALSTAWNNAFLCAVCSWTDDYTGSGDTVHAPAVRASITNPTTHVHIDSTWSSSIQWIAIGH